MYRHKSMVVHARVLVCDICDTEETGNEIPRGWNVVTSRDKDIRHICPKCTIEKVIPFIDSGADND